MTSQSDLTALLGGQESDPIEFPAGLVGCQEWHRFVLITHPEGGPLGLLQSLDDERVSFIVADPRQIVPGYRLSLSEPDARALQLPAAGTPPEEVDVYCTLSVPGPEQEEPFRVTANLLGPLVINRRAGLGRQVILSDSDYNPRHELPVVIPAPSASAAKEGA